MGDDDLDFSASEVGKESKLTVSTPGSREGSCRTSTGLLWPEPVGGGGVGGSGEGRPLWVQCKWVGGVGGCSEGRGGEG